MDNFMVAHVLKAPSLVLQPFRCASVKRARRLQFSPSCLNGKERPA
jgi:hypothetical protein